MASHSGVLLTCDPTICEFIKHLNKNKFFIIKELDDRHLFIDPTMTDWIQEEVEKLLDKNTFKVPRA